MGATCWVCGRLSRSRNRTFRPLVSFPSFRVPPSTVSFSLSLSLSLSFSLSFSPFRLAVVAVAVVVLSVLSLVSWREIIDTINGLVPYFNGAKLVMNLNIEWIAVVRWLLQRCFFLVVFISRTENWIGTEKTMMDVFFFYSMEFNSPPFRCVTSRNGGSIRWKSNGISSLLLKIHSFFLGNFGEFLSFKSRPSIWNPVIAAGDFILKFFFFFFSLVFGLSAWPAARVRAFFFCFFFVFFFEQMFCSSTQNSSSAIPAAVWTVLFFVFFHLFGNKWRRTVSPAFDRNSMATNQKKSVS